MQQGLVVIDGQGMSVPTLEEEAVLAVFRAAEAGLTSLAGADSVRLPFLRAVRDSAASLLPAMPVSQAQFG
jgi:hypothetical protein